MYMYVYIKVSDTAALFVSGCACPGDTITYECTAVGAGATVWTGSAFNCSNSDHNILLLHIFFSLAKGDYGSCNNGDIVGQSLSVEGNNYTSQLNVTVTSDTAGRTIECLHDAYDGLTATLIFISVIPIIGMYSCIAKIDAAVKSTLIISHNHYVGQKYQKTYFQEDVICADFVRFLRLKSTASDMDMEPMIYTICCD